VLSDYKMRLSGVRFRANIGASRSERSIPQEVVVEVELHLPLSSFPKRDDRSDVVDYGAVAQIVVEEGLAEPYRLLETYVGRLVRRLLDETPASRVRVAATKLRVPTRHSVDCASVELVGDRTEEPAPRA
jgi:dihydroneopterin aldolase